MVERVSATDLAVLRREDRAAPQHLGVVMVFEPTTGGIDYDTLVRLVDQRIPPASRYRRKLRRLPGPLADPAWVDDPTFDLDYHVRRSVLPRPGSEQQLLDLCARVLSRPLDRSRPLWEMYLVEGLATGHLAVVTKTHLAVCGERGGADVSRVVLGARPAATRAAPVSRPPAADRTALAVVRDTVLDTVLDTVFDAAGRPARVLQTVRGAAAGLSASMRHATVTRAVTGTVASVLSGRAPLMPFHADLGHHRRLAVARTALDVYREVRDSVGGTVDDVALTVVTGALREWLLGRAIPLEPTAAVTAAVDLGDDDTQSESRDGAGLRAPQLVGLPVGEPDVMLRLAQVREARASQVTPGSPASSSRPPLLGRLAPPALRAFGGRSLAGLTGRRVDLVVSRVSAPQAPVHLAGARMTEMFPVVALRAGRPLSIAFSMSGGGVRYAVNADRDAVPDVAALAALLDDSLGELLTAARGATRRRFAAAGRHPAAAALSGRRGGAG